MRMLIATLVCLSFVAQPAFAIEQDAPERLISAEEALIIKLRMRLDRLKSTKKPYTQREKGEAIDRAGLRNFYASHGHTPLWANANGLNERAQAALKEIADAHQWGLDPAAFDLPSDPLDVGADGITTTQRVDLEMRVSLAVLKYARHARGGRMDPTDLSHDIDRKPPVLDAKDVLKGAQDASDVGAFLRGLHPQHEQFAKLRTAYLKALEDEANGQIDYVEPERKRKGKRARKRRAKFKRSQRILFNMEMWRWMPEDLGQTHVWANVPEFIIRVKRDASVIHSERMITGKVKNKTPVFSDELETVVFNPFWNVPNSIKVKELLPKLLRGGSLAKQGLRIKHGGREVNPLAVDWSRNDIRKYHVYQPPAGRRNALGVVKFLFPNKHAVYFHDTPTKHLFKKKVRAFSHGCMRVRDPLKMAAVLLGEDRGWGRSKVDEVLRRSGDNNEIVLKRKIPVHVTYFTAHVDDDGAVQFKRDLYGHEARIKKGIEGKAHTIVKENRSLEKHLAARRPRNRDRIDPFGRFASGGGYQSPFFQSYSNYAPNRRRNNKWKRQVWGND